MYIAMNRFKVSAERIEEFETVWRTRERHLDEMKGFKKFQVLKGEVTENYCYYISKTDWDSKEDFFAWTNSEQFKAAHANAKTPKGIILGPPQFEGFEVVMEE